MASGMTRQHFQAIADAFKECMELSEDQLRPDIRKDALRRAAIEVSGNISKFNPNFDRVRFLEACGVEVQP